MLCPVAAIGHCYRHGTLSQKTIDLGLTDQSVGKRSLYLMDTVNAKKRCTIYWRVNKFLKECHLVTRVTKERPSILKIIDINDNSFFRTPKCHHCFHGTIKYSETVISSKRSFSNSNALSPLCQMKCTANLTYLIKLKIRKQYMTHGRHESST
jgi:hypothetical protein